MSVPAATRSSTGGQATEIKESTEASNHKAEQEPKGPKRSEDFYDEDADVEIISSDNVLFKVWAYHLQAGSSVFRSLIAGATASPIELVDPEFETASVLSGLLTLAIGGEIQLEGSARETSRIAKLAMKYDFQIVLKQIALHARALLIDERSNWCALEAFLAGAAVDDRALCLSALRGRATNWTGQTEPSEKFGQSNGSGHSLDPGCAPLEDICALTPTTLWAWMRAYHTAFGRPVENDASQKEKEKTLSAEFERLMSLEGAPKSLCHPT